MLLHQASDPKGAIRARLGSGLLGLMGRGGWVCRCEVPPVDDVEVGEHPALAGTGPLLLLGVTDCPRSGTGRQGRRCRQSLGKVDGDDGASDVETMDEVEAALLLERFFRRRYAREPVDRVARASLHVTFVNFSVPRGRGTRE